VEAQKPRCDEAEDRDERTDKYEKKLKSQ